MSEDPPGPREPALPDLPEDAAGYRRAAAHYDDLFVVYQKKADSMRALRDGYLRQARIMEGKEPRPSPVPSRILRKLSDVDSVTGNMVTDRRLAISKGRTGKDKFAVAYRAKGYTLRSLAEAVGCSHTMLSMHRTDPDRKIPRERADKIAAKIDWPADRAHWPFGFAS